MVGGGGGWNKRWKKIEKLRIGGGWGGGGETITRDSRVRQKAKFFNFMIMQIKETENEGTFSRE